MAAWDTTLDTENGVSRSPGTSPAERVAAERELGDFQLQVTAEMTDFMSAQEAYFKAEVLFRKQADVLLNRLPPDPDGLGYDWPQEDYTDMVKYPIANLQDLVRYHGTIKPISQWIEHRQDDHVIYSHQGSVAWIVNGIGFVADRFIPDTEAGIVLTLVPFMPKGLKGLSRLLPEAEESLPGLLGDALPALENGGKSLLGIEDAAATNHRSLKIPFTNLQVNLPGFKIPSSTYNYDPALTGTKVMGHTLPNGDIFLRPGMTVAEETFALSHESVHSYLSVRGSGRIGDFRRALGMWGYNESAVLRYTEEAMAQGYATNSLLKALKFPIAKGYVTGTRLAIEGIGLGVGYGGSLYGSYRLGHYLGGSSTDIPGGGR